ncbi:MAG: aminotransferase class V-fold PLP-dependent enzyme [Flammeovirgaceae bacterium]
MLTLQRSKFSLARGATYLNCAYMSPLLKSVEKAGIQGMLRKRSPFQVSSVDFFTETETLRAEYAKLIGVENQKRIVMVPSVSYGMATVVKNLFLSAGENIVVAGEQFPSNFYPWKKLCDEQRAHIKAVEAPDVAARGQIWNERILDAIDSKTKAVALGHVHWADGTKFQLEQIRQRTRDVGALLVIDGTQSVGALPFDVKTIQPDALICGGYKWLMGPYSIGLAYYGEYFNEGKPLEENWINRLDSENFAGLVNYQSQYQPGALRYEVGEHSNFILVPMMLAAVRQVAKWRPENIQQYCRKISSKATGLLQNEGYWVEDPNFRGHHLFGIRIPKGHDLEKIKLALAQAKISVSVRGNAIRVSPHVYNTEEEMMKLVKALTR